MQHRILLITALLYLIVANVVWIMRDTRPPFWDMATHMSSAVHVYDAFVTSGPLAIATIPALHLTGYYPPLYHTLIAATFGLFGKTVNVARLANIVPIVVLVLATYGIGRFLLDKWSAALAAVVGSFYPVMLWLSRETMIDYWLAAIVALAMWSLLKSDGFSTTRSSIEFGVVAGLGMLTKWTFPFFVLLPAVWLARRNWRNAVVAAAVAAAISAYWYVPSAVLLRQFSQINTAGAVFEGDPERFSIAAMVFYVRLLEGYQLFLPLFMAFIAGAVILKTRLNPSWLPVLLWILGGWLGLMLFRNKDPRYSAPLLPAIALITVLAFERRRLLTGMLLIFLVFQHYLVSFGIGALPERVVVLKGVDGQLSWDWNLYTQSYFGLWGHPAHEDWKIERVLAEVCSSNPGHPIRLALVPDIPRFDSSAFQLYVDLLKLPVRLTRQALFDQPAITGNDYIVLAEKDLEHPASFAPDPRVSRYVLDHPETFQIAESFSLPNGDIARLYRIR